MIMVQNIANPQFQFTSSKWNERLNDYCENENYPNGYYSFAETLASNIIKSIMDMFSITADDVVSLLSGTDNENVKKMKAKKKFLYGTVQTPARYRDCLLPLSLNARIQMLFTTIRDYAAHKAFQAGRRFSAFDAHGDADSVRKYYDFYLNNTDTSDWTALREYIIQVAENI